MLRLQGIPNYPLPTKPLSTFGKAASETKPLGEPSQTVNVVVVGSSAASPYLNEQTFLYEYGKHLATLLAGILDKLEKYDQEAIDSIVSILEPYMEVDNGFDIDIHPKYSRDVTIEITNEERAKPKIYLD